MASFWLPFGYDAVITGRAGKARGLDVSYTVALVDKLFMHLSAPTLVLSKPHDHGSARSG